MPAPVEPLVASTKRFGFSNERDFKFFLRATMVRYDSIREALIEPGVSLGRAKPELHVSLRNIQKRLSVQVTWPVSNWRNI